MVHHFINQFKSDITSIPWVERYGGLARPVTQVSTNKDGQTFIKKYPVSCEINNDQCFKKGRYLDLVPDEKYKSLVYWEQTGILGMTPVQKMPEAYDLYEFRAPVQLVVWLNLQKLGFTGCDAEHIFAGHIFRVLAKASRKHMTSPYKIEQVSFIPKGILDNASKVFSGYTYGTNKC
jgi:hypothetical protein